MKKFFLTLVASLALCSYSYAQDDDDEYEDDDTPAVSSAPSSQATEPAASTASTSTAKDGGEMLGFGLELLGTLDAIDDDNLQKFYVTFKLFPDMEISAIFGLYHRGEKTRKTKNPAGETDLNDDRTQLQLGVGFDYFITEILLPISVGGEFLFSHWQEDGNQVTLNAFAGLRANLVSHLYLSGKLGFGFDYIREPVEGSNHNQVDARFDLGFKTQVQLHWFFL